VAKHKPKKRGSNTQQPLSSSIQSQQLTQAQAPIHAPKPERSLLVLLLELLGILAAIATIVAGTGYAFERWQDTTATIDFSGEIDQKKPFSIPLVIENPSTIFAAHSPRVACWIEAEYLNPNSTGHALLAADQPSVSAGMGIPPNQTRNYFCKMPDNFTLSEGDKPGGPIIPIKQAEMLVKIEYDTWLPWLHHHEVVTQFVMLQTSTGFRWIKGQWAGSTTIINWPTGTAPPWRAEKPKLPQ